MVTPVSEGECDEHGQMMCSGDAMFAQCVFGKWLLRSCTTGTVCKMTEDTNSPTVYCGFP
jgi:hypothetical protein